MCKDKIIFEIEIVVKILIYISRTRLWVKRNVLSSGINAKLILKESEYNFCSIRCNRNLPLGWWLKRHEDAILNGSCQRTILLARIVC